jgi:hypothetical protein
VTDGLDPYATGNTLDYAGLGRLSAGLNRMISEFIVLVAELDQLQAGLRDFSPGSTLSPEETKRIADTISHWLLVAPLKPQKGDR